MRLRIVNAREIMRFYEVFSVCLLFAYMHTLRKMDVALLESPAMSQDLDVAKVRELRKKLGLTQAEIAAKAGMSLPRWNDIETGRRANVTLDTLNIVAAALGCDARDLLTASKPTKRKG